MPIFQQDKYALPCVLGPVSSNSHNSMLHTSWIICFDSGLKRLYDWICRRSCWRACRSGWFSIFWINSRTLVLCACFTTECGNPGIRKSMSASFTIIDSWLKSSWSITDLPVLSLSVSSPTLNVSLSWTERVWELSDTVITSCVITGLPVRSCACSTLRSFLSSDERAWITLVSWTGFPVTSRPVRSEEPGFSRKELTSISWERDVFLSSCTPITSCVITGLPVRLRIGVRIGWFDWKLLDSCPISDRWACSEPHSLFHSCFKEIFGGGRGDMYTFFVKDFSSFHPNNFRNTTSWKCFLKDDCIRSSLIECQSFLNIKININPIHRILMFLPCFMHVLCMTRFIQVDRIRILMVFVHGIHRQEEYCLSLARTLTSKH